MPDASINDVRLYYEERGSGTSILGIHGGGSSAVFWEDAAERLAELGRVITYDRRGSNRSDRPDPYEVTSVGEHTDDALALLRALDAEPAIVIGRSYGGTIALDLALRHPESALGVALLEAGPMGLSPEYDAWFRALRATLESVDAPAVGETVLREVFGAWEELPRVWRDVFTANGPALLAEVRGEERLSEDAHLDELSVPALIVTANGSPEPIQRSSEALARALPGARAVRVSGDHAIDPGRAEVLAFVAELVSA
ncbi:MAG TPA: alpha/beta fold hydrolase [Gaiellaceae bacterium]|nr:alpha/beta fold hydrolase [Gaiellaceae bacterium]